METRDISLADKSFYMTRSGTRATVLETRVTLTQEVVPQALRDALATALRVHTNFRTRPVIVDHAIKATIDDVTELPLFQEDGRTRRLGTADTAGLLLYVTYSSTSITLHVFHGVADLRGIYAFLVTLLKAYFADLGMVEAVLPDPDSVDTMPFYEHILDVGSPAAPKGLYNSVEHKIFALPVKRFGKHTTRQRMFQIDIPLDPLLALARSSGSSVVPTMQAAIGRAIHETFKVGDKEIVGYTPVDLRRHYNVGTGGNGSSFFSIPYVAELDGCDISERARRLRGEMDAQITPENLFAIVAVNCKRMVELVLKLPFPVVTAAKIATHISRQIDKRRFTYGVSYPGKITFGDQIDRYVASVTACAGSYSYPMWVMACEINGIVRMTITQDFDDDALAKKIYDELSRALPGVTFEDQGYHAFDEFHL